MVELSDVGYVRDLTRKNLVIYEMKGLPGSTYPATDLGYLDWEFLLRYHTPIYPNDYGTIPIAIMFANVYNKDAEDLVQQIASFGTGQWPGISFSVQSSTRWPSRSDKIYALLGTSFGQYATYFLCTHRSKFGAKILSKIHITTPYELPIGWDTEDDGPYPHVFIFRFSDPVEDDTHPTGGESSAQAAARLGGSSQHAEHSPHAGQHDGESTGDESSGQAVSSHEGSPHSQHKPQEESPGGETDFDQPMGGTTAEGSKGSSGHSEQSPDRMDTSD